MVGESTMPALLTSGSMSGLSKWRTASTSQAVEEGTDKEPLLVQDQFQRSFEVTMCAGILMLAFICLLVSFATALCCYVVSFFTSWYYGMVALPALEFLFLLYGYYRWKMYFSDLSYRDSPENPTHLPFPFAKDHPDSYPLTLRPTKMSLRWYLWCMHFIWIFFSINALRLMILSSLKQSYIRIFTPELAPVELVFGEMALNGSLVTWFKEILESPQGTKLARFSSSFFGPQDFPCADNSIATVQNIEFVIDLQSRKCIAGKVDGKDVSIIDVFMLAAFVGTSRVHSWSHALGMWGVKPTASEPYFERLSICSGFFNHLGGDGGGFIYYSSVMKQAELIDDTAKALPQQRAMIDHAVWQELIPYSRFVSFIEHVRPPFFDLSSKHELSTRFPMVEPEAHFWNTVIHGIDHTMFVTYMDRTDVLGHFIRRSPENLNEIDYSAIGRWLMFVSCLSQDFPKLFQVHMWDSPEIFYREVYEEAKKWDPELAFHLQTCIIK